jgi:hypothetical protein
MVSLTGKPNRDEGKEGREADEKQKGKKSVK